MWYAAYLIKSAAGPRRPVAAPAPSGGRIPDRARQNALEGQRAFAMRGTTAAPTAMNPALRNALLMGGVGAAGLGAGYLLGRPLSKALMPDGSHALPGPAPEATDPAARINKEMEEKRKAVQMTPAVQ